MHRPAAAALPGGVVGVLDRQRRERVGLAAAKAAYRADSSPHQHAHRPAVGDDVVHASAAARARPPARRSSGRGSAGLWSRSNGAAASSAAAADTQRRVRGRRRRAGRARPGRSRHRRRRCAAPARRRRSTKVVRRLSWRATMRSSARLQRGHVEAPLQAQRDRDVVGRAGGVSSWSRNHSRCCANDSGSGRVAVGHAPIGGQLARAAPSRPSRAKSASTGASNRSRRPSSTPSACAQARHQPAPPAASGRRARRSRRARPDPLDAQHLGPDRRERLLDLAVAAPRSRAWRARRRRAPAAPCDRACRSAVSGSASSTHERRRHHVVGQPRRQTCARSSPPRSLPALAATT